MRSWLRSYLLDRAQKKVAAHLRATRSVVNVRPLQGLFNYRCHENSVEWIRTHPGQKLSLVEMIYLEDDGVPVLHYCVQDDQAQVWEVTLGWRAEAGLEFYAMRVIPKEDHYRIHREFNQSLDYWLRWSTPGWLIWLSGLERVV